MNHFLTDSLILEIRSCNLALPLSVFLPEREIDICSLNYCILFPSCVCFWVNPQFEPLQSNFFNLSVSQSGILRLHYGTYTYRAYAALKPTLTHTFHSANSISLLSLCNVNFNDSLVFLCHPSWLSQVLFFQCISSDGWAFQTCFCRHEPSAIAAFWSVTEASHNEKELTMILQVLCNIVDLYFHN